MAAPLPWLPESALDDPSLAEAVSPSLAEFSVNWFTSGMLRAGGRWRREEPGFPSASNRVQTAASGHRLLVADCAPTELASALLGRVISERELRTSADHSVVDALCNAALNDLGARLSKALGDRPGEYILRPGEDRWTMALAIVDSEPFAWVEASASLLVALRQRSISKQRRGARPDPPLSSLRSQAIVMTAILGHGRAALSDLQQLATGDVIPLDKPVGEALDLALNDHKVGAKAGQLTESGTHLNLTIERPVAQW